VNDRCQPLRKGFGVGGWWRKGEKGGNQKSRVRKGHGASALQWGGWQCSGSKKKKKKRKKNPMAWPMLFGGKGNKGASTSVWGGGVLKRGPVGPAVMNWQRGMFEEKRGREGRDKK